MEIVTGKDRYDFYEVICIIFKDWTQNYINVRCKTIKSN